MFFYFSFFFLGLCFGSFANVLIFRIKNIKDKKSIFFTRSFCPKCKTKLGVFDLIPFFSWFFLCAKCRYCKKSISSQYPIVELIMGIVFSFVFYFYTINEKTTAFLVFALFLSFVLVVISVYDILYFEIMDEIILPYILIVFLLILIAQFSDKMLFLPSVLFSFYGFLIPTAFFMTQIIISNGKWIGGGDLRMGVLMGIILGPMKTIVALFLSYLLGSIISIIILTFIKFKSSSVSVNLKELFKTKIPFLPFLSVGTFFSFFYSEEIIAIYKSIFF